MESLRSSLSGQSSMSTSVSSDQTRLFVLVTGAGKATCGLFTRLEFPEHVGSLNFLLRAECFSDAFEGDLFVFYCLLQAVRQWAPPTPPTATGRA